MGKTIILETLLYGQLTLRCFTTITKHTWVNLKSSIIQFRDCKIGGGQEEL